MIFWGAGRKNNVKNSIHTDRTLGLYLNFWKSEIAGKQENGSEFHVLEVQENKPLEQDLLLCLAMSNMKRFNQLANL